MPRFCGMMDHNGGFGLLALGSLGRPTVGVLVYNSFFFVPGPLIQSSADAPEATRRSGELYPRSKRRLSKLADRGVLSKISADLCLDAVKYVSNGWIVLIHKYA